MSLISLFIGLLIGVFLPSPIDKWIRGWVTNLWNKIFNKE